MKVFAYCVSVACWIALHVNGLLLGERNNGVCEDTIENCDVLNDTVYICDNTDYAKPLCSEYCSLCHVDGSWSAWSYWSDCDVTCGSGTRLRVRMCNSPPPTNHGRLCDGHNNETTLCALDVCPVHGGWSVWSNWTDCSVSCGTGLKHRTRLCDKPRPAYEGMYCDGNNIEYNICEEGTCPGRALAFLARRIQSVGITNEVTFIDVDLNKGNDYNSTTGKFTCRIPGTYMFSATIYTDSSAERAYCNFFVNSKQRFYIQSSQNEAYHASYTASGSAVFHLNVGDTVSMGSCSAVSTFVTSNCFFTGFLIAQ